jgi:hypothetical protein
MISHGKSESKRHVYNYLVLHTTYKAHHVFLLQFGSYYKKFLYVTLKDCHCLTMSYVDDEKTIDDNMTPISATGSFTTQTLKKTILVLQYKE